MSPVDKLAPKVSVVIPAYNEEKYIAQSLDSLCKQTTDVPFEVIVVDNASSDNTAKVAKTFQDRLSLRVVRESRKGRGAARHTGSMAAKGEIILSTDADTILPPHWIEVMVGGFSDPKVVAVTGTGYINDCSWFTNKSFNILQRAFTVLHYLIFDSYCICGFNGGFRKDAYIKSGGYRRDLNTYEDTQFGFDIRRFGKTAWLEASHVRVSGRRFRNGVLPALYEYARPFTSLFLFRRKNAYLRDAR